MGRDFKRLGASEDRWNSESIRKFVGTPWEPVPGRAEDSIPVRVRVSEEGESIMPNPDTLGTPKLDIKRRARITREDIVRVGYTINCPGCKAISRYAPAQNHTELCRARVEAALISEGGTRAKKVAEGRERYTPAVPLAKRQQVFAESESSAPPESPEPGVPHSRKRQAEDVEHNSQEKHVKHMHSKRERP